jgi:predicted nucleic acid-binding protein
VYLLDTNIVSEVLRRRPDPKVIARLSQVEPEEIHASVITLFELRFGSMLRADAARFWQKIETEILPLVRWLDVDRSVAGKAGDIAAKLQKLGTPIGVNDCLIGGTALVPWSTIFRSHRFCMCPGIGTPSVNHCFSTKA